MSSQFTVVRSVTQCCKTKVGKTHVTQSTISNRRKTQ